MNKTCISKIVVLMLIATILSGCISGGDDVDEVTTTAPPTTAAPTTSAPTTAAPTTAAPTQPPTTVPPTPAYVHNECSTLFMDQDSGNTRYYDCEISDDPQEVWAQDIGLPLSHILTDYERAFYIDAAPSEHTLRCLDVESGDLYWETTLPFLSYYDMILYEEKLYVFKDGEEKTLICYDAHDGSMLWTSEDITDLFSGIGALMANGMNRGDDRILITLGEMGGERNVICVFDANNGEVLWHKTVDYHISSHPAIENGVAYFTTLLWEENDKILGFDIDTGATSYVYSNPNVSGFNGRQLAVSEGRIYTQGQRMDDYETYVFCISTTSNTIVWQHEVDRWGENITVGDEHVFLAIYEMRGQIISCLDKSNGKEVWSMSLDFSSNVLRNFPIATPDKLVVFGPPQYETEEPLRMLIIDIASGEEIWRKVLDGNDISRSASFLDGKILIGTDRGKIYCFE